MSIRKVIKKKWPPIQNHVLVVAPNYTLDVINTSFDALYSPNDKGHFKRRDDLVQAKVLRDNLSFILVVTPTIQFKILQVVTGW